MNNPISDLAITIIGKENPNVNVEWLECLNDDLATGEITAKQCYQLTKAFIRGLMATGAVGVEVLDDIDNAYASGGAYNG